VNRVFLKCTFTFLIALIFINLKSSAQQNYFIDAVNGNDVNNGTSISPPWKNLSKLYNLTISAGSTINLKNGSVWIGQQLKFKGSGTNSSPIIINNYGNGAKPIIHGNGLTGQGVVIYTINSI